MTAAPQRRLLIVVDIQNDFCERGALAVAGGNEVARRVAAYLRDSMADHRYAAIAVSQDHHRPGDDNGGHFADPPDFVDSWPPHCVAGTLGAALHPAIDEVLGELADESDATTCVRVLRVRKGYGMPAYSALEGVLGDPADDASPEPFVAWLEREGFDAIDVVGLALDYCVAATARDARGICGEVRVIEDLTAAIDAAGIPDLRAELAERGIDLIARP